MVSLVLIGFYFIGIYTCIDSARILHAPYLEEVQLKTPLTFNISFIPENGTTLSVAQIFDDVTTELLLINGTEFTLQNDWTERASINIDNGTEQINVEVTIERTSLVDEGDFTIRILDQQQTELESIPYKVKTYALPVSLTLQVDSNNHTESNQSTFTCTGNVGRPMGILQLSRSTIRNSTEYFAPVYTLGDLTQISKTELPNGTFSINHVFYLELTRNDDQRYFRCDVISSRQNHTLTFSNVEQMFVKFEGTLMTINPDNLVLNSGIPPTLTMSCQLTNTESSTNVGSFIYIQIKRNSTRETSQVEVIASRAPDGGAQIGGSSDIQNRAPNVTGNLQKENNNVSPPLPRLVDLTMTWNSSLIQCEDEGEYHCVVGYLETDFSTAEWTSSASLTNLQTIPEDLRLEVTRNGFPIGSGDGTENNPLRYSEGDTVHISCSAKIGSNRNTRIEWYHTRPFDTTNTFQKFSPGFTDVLDDGQVSDNRENCQYSRTSTLKYNITSTDTNRQNDLAFKCMIDISINNVPYTIESDRSVFINAGSSNPGGNTQEVASAGGGSNAGAIAGGVIGGLVLIVLVVLLVYFLWYRRRGDGDYRTKEDQGAENPNMVPASVDYAVPNKKKSYQNDGLDEPHQDRRNHHNDYDRHAYNENGRRGRSNHGMDRDEDGYTYDSRDGSPTMTPHVNHMGDDGSIGTGV